MRAETNEKDMFPEQLVRTLVLSYMLPLCVPKSPSSEWGQKKKKKKKKTLNSETRVKREVSEAVSIGIKLGIKEH